MDKKLSNINKKSQIPHLILLLFFLIKCQSIVYPYSDPHFYYSGRNYLSQNGLHYDWPCFTLQFCFVNTSKIWWLINDTFSHYSVILNDKQAHLEIPKSKNKISIYQRTPSPIKNCIKIVKITQDHFGPLGIRKDATFKGIQLEGVQAKLVERQKKYSYKFEFVGDSLTAGYGDLSGTNIKCFFRMRHNQNCLEDWSYHLANKFNAQVRIEAESGKGVVKNAPFIFGQVMPVLYTKITSNSKPNTYTNQDKYAPDVIFVFLGVNDYSNLNIIKPSQNSFVYGYEKILTEIVNLQFYSIGNKPKIIGLCTSDFPQNSCKNVKKAIDSFRFAYQKAYFVEIPAGIFVKGDLGCINHPNVAGHHKIAEAIYQNVKNILEK